MNWKADAYSRKAIAYSRKAIANSRSNAAVSWRRTCLFALRNGKEILRDPLNLGFGIGFPLVVLLLLTAIQRHVPVPLFQLEALTPGITVFGLSFLTLFSATMIAKDRSTAFMARLCTTPMEPVDFMIGYTLPVVPMALAQGCICYIAALVLGLPPTIHIVGALLGLVPVSIFYIALGLLCGSVFTDKQVGGICGALLTNLSAWLSGTWFDLSLVGGTFQKIAHALPFVHAVELEKAVLAGDYSTILPHLWWVLGYAAVCMAAAVVAFMRQSKR